MKKSFTLIELLLTLFIIVMLTAASLPMIRKFQRSADVKVVANEIKSAILQAQNYSLAPRVGTTGVKSYSIVFNVKDPALHNQYCIIENYDPDTKTCSASAVSGTLRTLPQNVEFDASSFRWDKYYIVASTSGFAYITFSVTNQGRIDPTNWAVGQSAAVIKVVNANDSSEAWNISVNKITGAVTVSAL